MDHRITDRELNKMITARKFEDFDQVTNYCFLRDISTHPSASVQTLFLTGMLIKEILAEVSKNLNSATVDVPKPKKTRKTKAIKE